MAFTRTQIGIAVGAGVLLVGVFVGYLWWLSNQGPVLARSDDHDPLTGLPVSIKMNPLRDRSTEKAANKFLREIRDGHCDDVLSKWEHDYHKKYAHYICNQETQHPLLSWELVDWEDAPPVIILHYRGKRQTNPGEPGIDRICSPSPRSSRAASGSLRSTCRSEASSVLRSRCPASSRVVRCAFLTALPAFSFLCLRDKTF